MIVHTCICGNRGKPTESGFRLTMLSQQLSLGDGPASHSYWSSIYGPSLKIIAKFKKKAEGYWLVVWLPFFIFPYIGLLIIPIDFHRLSFFQRGGPTTNQDNFDQKLISSNLENVSEFHENSRWCTGVPWCTCGCLLSTERIIENEGFQPFSGTVVPKHQSSQAD